MDEQRFDAWTRALARGLSRRNALRALAGLTVAGAATRLAAHEAMACTATLGGVCDLTMGCCADLGLACLGPPGTGICVAADSESCPFINNTTNECVQTISQDPKCEGRGCKKKAKKCKKLEGDKK